MKPTPEETTIKLTLIEGGISCNALIELLGAAGFTNVLIGCGRVPVIALRFSARNRLKTERGLRTLLGSAVAFAPPGAAL